MDLSILLGGSAGGYARAEAVRELAFPQDHGVHPEFRTEWWYFTGNLKDEQGKRYGFQLTFFRFALSPQPSGRQSAWATNQIYMAHFAITDLSGKRFYGFERFSRGTLGLAGAEGNPFRVWLEGWEASSMNGDEPASGEIREEDKGSREGYPFSWGIGVSPRKPLGGWVGSPMLDSSWGGEWIPAQARHDTTGPDDTFPWNLEAEEGGIALSLIVEPLKGIVLQGDQGLSQKGPEPGNASYYYSISRLDASGILTLDGEEHAVAGTAWFDHEWSTSALGENLAGWDWFALQFEDGTDLMYYQLRHRDGGTDPHSEGTIVDPAGNTVRLPRENILFEVLDTWRSPQTGAAYPIKWKVRVEPPGKAFIVRAALEGQEQNLSVRYWEGAVDILDEQEAESLGWGYVELTGYASH